jgi:two-component system response regulator FixJ
MSGPVVAVVDDQASVRDALAEMLNVFGYSTAVYESAVSFLEKHDLRRPGCVICDVRMPGMDGIELVRELGKRKVSLPVIVISGHADVPMAVAAIKAGAHEFIEKPVNDELLIGAINKCLAHVVDQLGSQQSLEELRVRYERMTPREAQVFKLVAQGYTSPVIAGQLNISVRT